VPDNVNQLATLHIKLSRTAKALKGWAKSLVSQGKMAMIVCREVLYQLERAQESRQLTLDEFSLIKHLKTRLLGLATIEKKQSKTEIKVNLAKKRGCKYQVFLAYGQH
jgi:hypothetical protein